jgi:hypothetical protein
LGDTQPSPLEDFLSESESVHHFNFRISEHRDIRFQDQHEKPQIRSENGSNGDW